MAEALAALAEHGESARVIAGGTDLILELSRGSRVGVDTLIDLGFVDGLDSIVERGDGVGGEGDLSGAGRVELGPMVTHGDVVSSARMVSAGLPLAQACLEVGAPQLRNRATVAGNIVTASPANDTLSALYALGADVEVTSAQRTRTMPISSFVTGFRSTALAADELVSKIAFDALGGSRRGVFAKLGLRRAQAISVVHCAVVVEQDQEGRIADLRVALGSVGPTIEMVQGAAAAARGRRLADAADDVALAARESVRPIDDLRSTSRYRSHAVGVIVRRAMLALAVGAEADAWPERPVRLSAAAARRPTASRGPEIAEPADHLHPPVGSGSGAVSEIAADHGSARRARALVVSDADAITVTVNGRERSAANAASRTLLDWLRRDLGLTGTKEGCAEGECGACTVHMDGQAVLACLVPAARAAGARLTTVEGLAPHGEGLHPVQRALADDGVQCGFCTPGFVMSAAMLKAEQPCPSRAEVEQGLSGNLCRCTGYYPIIDALVGHAAAAAPT